MVARQSADVGIKYYDQMLLFYFILFQSFFFVQLMEKNKVNDSSQFMTFMIKVTPQEKQTKQKEEDVIRCITWGFGQPLHVLAPHLPQLHRGFDRVDPLVSFLFLLLFFLWKVIWV
jgi:hypothetical protein